VKASAGTTYLPRIIILRRCGGAYNPADNRGLLFLKWSSILYQSFLISYSQYLPYISADYHKEQRPWLVLSSVCTQFISFLTNLSIFWSWYFGFLPLSICSGILRNQQVGNFWGNYSFTALFASFWPKETNYLFSNQFPSTCLLRLQVKNTLIGKIMAVWAQFDPCNGLLSVFLDALEIPSIELAPLIPGIYIPNLLCWQRLLSILKRGGWPILSFNTFVTSLLAMVVFCASEFQFTNIGSIFSLSGLTLNALLVWVHFTFTTHLPSIPAPNHPSQFSRLDRIGWEWQG